MLFIKGFLNLLHDVDYHLVAQKPYFLQRLACQDDWISEILQEPWSCVYRTDAKWCLLVPRPKLTLLFTYTDAVLSFAKCRSEKVFWIFFMMLDLLDLTGALVTCLSNQFQVVSAGAKTPAHSSFHLHWCQAELCKIDTCCLYHQFRSFKTMLDTESKPLHYSSNNQGQAWAWAWANIWQRVGVCVLWP